MIFFSSSSECGDCFIIFSTFHLMVRYHCSEILVQCGFCYRFSCLFIFCTERLVISYCPHNEYLFQFSPCFIIYLFSYYTTDNEATPISGDVDLGFWRLLLVGLGASSETRFSSIPFLSCIFSPTPFSLLSCPLPSLSLYPS